MTEKNGFAEALVKFRKEKGMTQKELASKLNVSDKAVSRWETGKNYPDIETLKKLAELLDITINDLLKGNLKLTKKKSPYKKVIAAAVIILLAVYMFPFYNWLKVTGDNFYGAKDASYVLFRGVPTHHMKAANIIDAAEMPFSDLGLSAEEAKKKYGRLSRYCITSDYKDVVKEKHKLKVWSVILNTYTSEYDGYIWVCYSQEGLNEKGELSTGCWEVPALWCLEKDENGEWYVSDIKESP